MSIPSNLTPAPSGLAVTKAAVSAGRRAELPALLSLGRPIQVTGELYAVILGLGRAISDRDTTVPVELPGFGPWIVSAVLVFDGLTLALWSEAPRPSLIGQQPRRYYAQQLPPHNDP